MLTLDTTLPRYYSRGFTVRGSKGFYMEDTDSVFIEGIHNQYHLGWKSQWGNAVEFEEKYDHPLWKAYKDQVRGGHDGMDWLVFRGFLESVKNGTQPPIDVYDTATLMCISALSEESIQHGGTAVAIPDFTGGRWLERHDTVKGKYCLRETARMTASASTDTARKRYAFPLSLLCVLIAGIKRKADFPCSPHNQQAKRASGLSDREARSLLMLTGRQESSPGSTGGW